MFSYFSAAVARDVRLATASDAEVCARIHALGFVRGWSALEFEALLVDQQVVAHLAIQVGNNHAEGFALSRIAADQAEILSIAILPDVRGRRLGGGLLRRHMTTLDSLGVRKLFLEVSSDNESALALYRANRFVEVGSRKNYYAGPGGKTSNALVMCCETLHP